VLVRIALEVDVPEHLLPPLREVVALLQSTVVCAVKDVMAVILHGARSQVAESSRGVSMIPRS
jgi:hypothetical protein